MRDNLAFIDEIIDRDEVPSNMTLHQYLTRTTKYRSRCKRLFGGVENALRQYGYYTDTEDWTDTSRKQQLENCLRIDGNYRPYFEGDAYNLLKFEGLDICWTKELRILRDTLIIEKYLYETDFWEVDKFQRKNGSPQHPVDRAVRNIYGTWTNFYKSIKYHPNLYGSDIRNTSKQGKEFEYLVEEVLKEVYKKIPTTQKEVAKGCIPDFVIDDRWYDAKRSRSTALGPNCNTIEKYRKHTDYLTIIYALHDTEEYDDRANFTCITEYYPYISDELKRKCNDFIARARATSERMRGYQCKKIS